MWEPPWAVIGIALSFTTMFGKSTALDTKVTKK
jgi:hypothetical protein